GLGLFELGQELLKARLQTGPYVLASTVRCVLAFALCLPVAYLGGGGIAQIGAAGLAYFVTSALIAGRVWRPPVAPIEWTRLSTFLTLGVSLTFSGFLFAFHSALDRLMVAWILGGDAAGVYGASADLVRQLILIPAGSVAAAATPLAVRALSQGGPGEARKQLEAGAELLLAVLVPTVIGVALTSPYLIEFVLGPAFRATARSIVPILAFAWLFQSITQSYVHLSYHLAKRPGLGTAQGLITLAVNATTLWPLIAVFGLPGAAASLVMAEAAGAASGFALSGYAHPLPGVLRPLRRVGAATGIMALVIVELERLLPQKTLASLALLIGGGVAAYGLAALAFDIADSRAFLSAVMQKRPSPSAGARNPLDRL
ncbi:MAG: polysaccharide biosynthesis protein, partial [Hyphomicrobiales bacterium]|nr:polysaccharide biosynthesis protein [Hyphomicrobiales bacterium]